MKDPIEFTSLVPLLSGEDTLALLFTLAFIVWAVYSVFAAYHWIRYGHDSWMAVPALFVHVFISGWLMIYATSGFN